MPTTTATPAKGSVRILQNKIQVKWDLAERYMRKALKTSSVPQRMQATHRSKAYFHQALALISTLPPEFREAARAADPRR